jgi:hypothetical protein
MFGKTRIMFGKMRIMFGKMMQRRQGEHQV